MRIAVIASLAVAAALAACGPREAEKGKTADPLGLASEIPETNPLTENLRAQAGQYYFDIVQVAGMERYGADNLGLTPEAAQRFSRNMDVTGPGVIASANGVEALVFTGCAAHNCGGVTFSVLAIDLANGDTFVGVKDAEGEAVLKSNARLQMLLTQTSAANSWIDPSRG